MARYKILFFTLLNGLLTLNAFGQWKLKIIEEKNFKKLQFEDIETNKIETSKSYQDIWLGAETNALYSDSQRKAMRFRFFNDNKWGLMNGQFKPLIKPQFEYLEIFIDRTSRLYPDKNPEIQGYLGFRDSKFYLYDIDFKMVDKSGLSWLQSIGMDFVFPTQLPVKDVSSILRAYDNEHLILLHSTPILILSKQGKVEKKNINYVTTETVYYLDSNGDEFDQIFEVENNVFYDHIVGAGWNVYEVFKRELLFPQWLDSLKFTYVLASDFSDTLDFDSILKNIQRHTNKGMLVNYDNIHYEKLYEDMRFLKYGNTKLFCLPICISALNGDEKIVDLRNALKNFSNFNRPAEIITSPTGVLYIGIREKNKLRLYDFIKHSFYKQDFDAIYPNEYITLPTPYDLVESYSSREYSCLKVRLNQKLGVYNFDVDKFYEIKNLEDVDFKQGYYTNPRSVYTGGTKFFIAKSKGKWGLTTLSIFESNDSISVPFTYDSLIFDFYNINNVVFGCLKAKMNNNWKMIDFHNNRIEIPNKEEGNLLLVKKFFDMGHQELAEYYVLTNPTGIKINDAITISDEYADDEFPRVHYTTDGILGGKTLVFNSYLRKVVDESLYDSIWLITCHDENNSFLYGRDYVTYYQFFNWSNSNQLQDMINSYGYFTIPYFLIFKNGLKAIISDKNEIIVPFTREDIEVSKWNKVHRKTLENDDTDVDGNLEYITEYQFNTATETLTVIE